jgi:ATP-dependent helicase HrpA
VAADESWDRFVGVSMTFSAEEIERRRALAPHPEFPPELPISAKRDEIARAISSHPVVIVCGETGSGKTTQLPKICLGLGRGLAALIGHTQPRRIAARATASRVAQELKSELGAAVGYKIRFTDRVSPRSYIKLMTDGILLAETQGDRELRQYDTLILDEAHERSLNIDFLLGYIKQLLPRRPDLKLVVTSATIDADRFSKHFDNAPVIEVSGRLYPIELRYRPVDEDDRDYDINQAIAEALDEVSRSGEGDALVFLPGEREIRDAAETLRKHHPAHTEILPLFARLSAAEQERVFRPHGGRRIVLATNVAETSLTVPGIRYVVDTGLARVKRYSYRNKVEQLRVESISRAAARQRAGRCGRVASGICVRLYSEKEFERRAEFTDPEVLRSSLASVILRMKSLGLGAPDAFPFLDPPSSRAIQDGYALLAELGAVDEANELTEVGRQLAKLPVDPRVGRMVLAAKSENSLREVLIIASALSVQDPRERPAERAAAADEAQKPFGDEKSDFLSWLKIWKFFEQALAHEKSTRKLYQACHERFLSLNRMREWRDIHSQLKELIGDLGWRISETPSTYDQIHRALLAGLLGNVGMKTDEGNFLGARGIRFWVHPGSGVGKRAGRWIMAAEITETTRLYARCVATVSPDWLESVGAHLVKRHRYDPHWEKQPAHVAAFERGTLYGLPLYAKRRVHYGPTDPSEARKIFIQRALVEGDWDTRAPFLAHNRRLVREIEQLEHKSRRPDVLVDEELIRIFYESRIPDGIHNGADFDRWRREAESADPKLLFLKREDLMRHEAAAITSSRFPHELQMAGRSFGLEYHHEPGSPRDGVTLTVPLAALNQVDAVRSDWLVPGLAREKITRLAKTLPHKLRHPLGPLPEFAQDLIAANPAADVPVAQAIARYALREWNLAIPADTFRPEMLPPHLSMNFLIVDEHGRQLAMGRNLAQLRAQLGDEAGERFSAIAKSNAPAARHTGWDFGDLEEVMEIRHGGLTLVGYPGLVDRGDAVSLEVFDSPEKAREAQHAGLRRLYMLQLKEQARHIEKHLPDLQKMVLQFSASGDAPDLKQQLLAAAFDRACMQEPWPRSRAEFESRREQARSRVTLLANEIARLVSTFLSEHAVLQKKIQAMIKPFPVACRDVLDSVARMMAGRFIEGTPYDRLQHFPRYLRAANLRLDKLRVDPQRDARLAAELAPLVSNWQREQAKQAKAGATDPRLEQFRWLLEELRVQLFAQELKTPVPVSVKRLTKIWQTYR